MPLRREPSPTKENKILRPPLEPVAEFGNLTRTFAASLFALVLGLACLYHVTDGGRMFTTETLRRAAVVREPRLLPEFTLRDAGGQKTSLRRLVSASTKVWIVDFVYTRCRTVCSALGGTYQQLQRRILDRNLGNRVGLLSISFDPERDDTDALQAYAVRMHAEPATWRIMTLSTAEDRRALLEAFGIVVVPAPMGEFQHNAALHIVDAGGRLVRIVDFDQPSRALSSALEWQ